VITPGFLTAVQDLGRFGHARCGVAPSGVLDPLSARVANLLVDNLESEACLEVTLSGLELGCLADLVIAVTGGHLGAHLNGRPIQIWRSLPMVPGDLLSFDSVEFGCRAYLAVGGGIEVPVVLDSKCTNLGSGFGGMEGRALQAGDIVFGRDPGLHLKAIGRHFDLNAVPAYPNDWQLRVLLGPQEDEFSETGLETLQQSVYRVSQQSDRTGIRLEGPEIPIRPDHPESIVSEGVVSGAIQIPGDGKPIIVLNETVSGGYRKIATVITADLPLTAQMVPGDRVVFQAVTLREAREAFWRMEENIARLRNRLQ
jgi:biotin-dependent carboxylase-like uncharacterized protein